MHVFARGLPGLSARLIVARRRQRNLELLPLEEGARSKGAALRLGGGVGVVRVEALSWSAVVDRADGE